MSSLYQSWDWHQHRDIRMTELSWEMWRKSSRVVLNGKLKYGGSKALEIGSIGTMKRKMAKKNFFWRIAPKGALFPIYYFLTSLRAHWCIF